MNSVNEISWYNCTHKGKLFYRLFHIRDKKQIRYPSKSFTEQIYSDLDAEKPRLLNLGLMHERLQVPDKENV